MLLLSLILRAHACTGTSMTWVRACVRACVCMWLCAFVCICAYVCACVCTCAYLRLCACMRVWLHACGCSCMRVVLYACILTSLPVWLIIVCTHKSLRFNANHAISKYKVKYQTQYSLPLVPIKYFKLIYTMHWIRMRVSFSKIGSEAPKLRMDKHELVWNLNTSYIFVNHMSPNSCAALVIGFRCACCCIHTDLPSHWYKFGHNRLTNSWEIWKRRRWIYRFDTHNDPNNCT